MFRNGKPRVAGKEWMLKRNGAYLPGVYEEVVESVTAIFLTDKVAVHVVADQSFTDENLGKLRKSGEEYLVTAAESETFIPDVYPASSSLRSKIWWTPSGLVEKPAPELGEHWGNSGTRDWRDLRDS